jgi:hypothetical protein
MVLILQEAVTRVVVHGVVRVELEVVDKLQLGNKATGHVRLFAANNQVQAYAYVTGTFSRFALCRPWPDIH